jgi:type I restriction enzyme M protein
VLGNTLTDPAFEGRTFDYGLSNPPFGVDWKQYRKRIETEPSRASRGASAGPAARVGRSLLFLMHLLRKMRSRWTERRRGPRGDRAQRLAAVHRRGGAGESNIRRWMLESTTSRRSWACPPTCSTTPASPPTSGC